MTEWQNYPNFSPIEFACKGENCCGGRSDMDDEFMAALQRLRTELGFALGVTSGFRCPEYNEVVSSTGRDGPHTSGKAADLAVDRMQTWQLLMRLGMGNFVFTGIGLKQKGGGRFIHLDTLTEPEHSPRPTVWTY